MNVEISPELEKDFKRFVLEKHGKLRGKLTEEMEIALSFYINHAEKINSIQVKEDFQDANAPE